MLIKTGQHYISFRMYLLLQIRWKYTEFLGDSADTAGTYMKHFYRSCNCNSFLESGYLDISLLNYCIISR